MKRLNHTPLKCPGQLMGIPNYGNEFVCLGVQTEFCEGSRK